MTLIQLLEAYLSGPIIAVLPLTLMITGAIRAVITGDPRPALTGIFMAALLSYGPYLMIRLLSPETHSAAHITRTVQEITPEQYVMLNNDLRLLRSDPSFTQQIVLAKTDGQIDLVEFAQLKQLSQQRIDLLSDEKKQAAKTSVIEFEAHSAKMALFQQVE